MFTCGVCSKTYKTIHALNGHASWHSSMRRTNLELTRLQNTNYQINLRHSVFLPNKYTTIYYKIIENPDRSGYTEKHHIIPKSCGCSNTTANIITLSARQHYICHLLLTKMFPMHSVERQYMIAASKMMSCTSTNQNRYMNGKYYQYIRNEFASIQSNKMKGSGNPAFDTMFVYHEALLKSVRIPCNEFEKYQHMGYKKGRILDFNKAAMRNANTLKKKEIIEMNRCNERTFYTNLHEQYMSSDLSLRKFTISSNLDISHVTLFVRFKSYGLKIKKIISSL